MGDSGTGRRPGAPVHGTLVVVCPALLMLMTPPQVHISLEVLLSAGIFLIMTVLLPGVQGAVVTGTQGAGVGVPSAAAVAAATAGLDWVVHMANGGTLAMGMLSMIVAAGRFEAFTRFFGRTIRLDGATPNEHCIAAPIVTS